jgi:predicted nucleic acid-binding protein
MNGKRNPFMINVVLNTNVLVSALLASGPPAAIGDLVAEGKLRIPLAVLQ